MTEITIHSPGYTDIIREVPDEITHNESLLKAEARKIVESMGRFWVRGTFARISMNFVEPTIATDDVGEIECETCGSLIQDGEPFHKTDSYVATDGSNVQLYSHDDGYFNCV